MRDPRPAQLKIGWVFPLFLAGVAVLAGRLYNIQIKNHRYLVEQARKQSQTVAELPANRGGIFDCHGTPLALSVNTPAIFADPGIAAVPARVRRWLPQALDVPPATFRKFLAACPDAVGAVGDPTRERIVGVTRQLAEFLGVSEEPLLRRLHRAMAVRLRDAARRASPVLGIPQRELFGLLSQPRRFVWLKRTADEACAQRVRALEIRGLCVRGEDRRAVTTAEGLAIGQWLGHVNAEGTGCGGLESQFEPQLCGAPGRTRLAKDGRGKRIARSAEPDVPPRHGCNLYLTIDRRVQVIVDRELQQVYEEFTPASASAIVMNPFTGQILAMGSVPGLDLSAKRELDPEELNLRSRNHPIQSVYEYGSTFKPFIAAAALDLGLLTPETKIDCENGAWTIRDDRGRRLRTLHDAHRYGILPGGDVIVYSSNIGAAKMGLMLGPGRMREYLSLYHFGRTWGIRLPAEEPGITTSARKWTVFTTTSVPMGQEVAGTPLQLITAFCSLVNGGRLMQPYLVEAVEDPNTGKIMRRRPRQVARVIRPETSAVMRRILAQVVQRGTGKRLRNSPYPIGGKTGTAQKSAVGGYSADKYVASFVGFAPVDRPEICVLVMVDEPSGSHYGGTVAAPAVGRIVNRTLATLESAPRRPACGPAVAMRRVDD